MKTLIVSMACAVLSLCAAAEVGESFKSPDGRLDAVPFAAMDGSLVLSVDYDGAKVVDVAVPGFVKGAGVTEVGGAASEWRNDFGERRLVRDAYTSLTVGNVEMRLYDAGLAWRLTYGGEGAKAFASEAVVATFAFEGDWRCWPVSHNQGHYEPFTLSTFDAMRPKPGFAPVAAGIGKMFNYEYDIPKTAEGPFVVEGRGWVTALGEAANTNFAKVRFGKGAKAYAVNAVLEGPAEVALPYTTPWYYVRVAESPAALYNGNDLLLNLNAPSKIADTSWIRPGKVLRVARLDEPTGRAAVDFVKANGMQYIELDCGWYGQEHTGDPLEPKEYVKPILAYAQEQGVPVILYVNREPLKRDQGGIDDILPTLKGWGVAGIKYGFVNVGSQRWNQWMTAAIEKGAAHGLMLDAHDEYRLTGQQRTWPNVMTVEGIHGNEEMPDAAHNAALIFTRYLAGPGDYTPCWKVGRVKNSLAHQLALGVATFSPWQFLYWYQRPEQIDAGNPALAVWKEMPTVWDETRALQGEIGDYAVVARRSGDTWFLAGLNANQKRTLTVPLDFLGAGGYTLRLFRDADPSATNALAAVSVETRRTLAADTLRVPCAANGGFAAILEPAPPLPDWEDPYVTSSNRLPARAVFVPAQDAETARAIAFLDAPRTASPWVLSLDGEWDFEWKARPDTNETKSAMIAVPSCWQLQGDYDPPIYTNARYPHVKNPPYIMDEPPKNYTAFAYRNPVGTYRRAFTVPEAWEGRRIVLHFAGVASAFYVRVNGVAVGYSEDSRLPAEFDVTDCLAQRRGEDGGAENTIEVEVYRWCDGSYLEDQDFWRLSGIYRSVWLVAEKKDGLRDIVIEPTLSGDLQTGELKITADCDGEVRATLICDASGGCTEEPENTESRRENTKDSPCLRDLQNLRVSAAGELSFHVENPHLWDCDAPNLYTLYIEAGGDWYAFPVGFRKVAITNSVLKVNNRRILVKGVNRHEMSPTGGYTVTLDEMRKDIETLKALNINAVRTCHYPDDPDWYTLCDLNGLYVTCEANIESHGMGYGRESLAHRADFRQQHIERDVRMVETLRNHPSIIVWSQGNEAGYGENFKAAREAMLALDRSRPIQYENPTYKKETRRVGTDIHCPMYRTPQQCEEFAANAPEMPLVSCEYAHAMGNSTGGFADFWALADRYDSFQGGYIWDFADQALLDPQFGVLSLQFAVDATAGNSATNCKPQTANCKLCYGGDFGDAPNDRNGHCNGIVDPFRRPHPGAYEVAHVHGLFPNSYPDPETVALDPLLANLKVEPCFSRAATDNDRGCHPPRCDGTATIRRVPIDAHTLRLDVVFEVPTNVPYAQRVGIALALPAAYTNLTWHGRGPHENYPDRTFSAAIGDWSADVSAPPPYIRPQDYGHYCDVSRLMIGDLAVKCIFSSNPRDGLKDTFGFAAWPWTVGEINKANHNEDLPPSSGVTLVLDADIMGAGGDDSWSRLAAPRPPHRPLPGRYTLTLELTTPRE